MVRGIFFDLDDTLFDRTAALRRWVAARVGSIAVEDLAWVIALDDRGRRPPWSVGCPPHLTIASIPELEQHA